MKIEEEFESNFNKSGVDDCWNWVGIMNGPLYGRFTFNGVRGLAHRWSYEIYKGEIGDLWVLHKCDNPRCVNPNHLFLGTALDNSRDMIEKGRLVIGKRYSGDENVSRRRPEVLVRGEEHHKSILTEENVLEIVRLYIKKHPRLGTKGLAERFGVQQATVSKVVRGVTWSHITGIKR